MRKSYQLEFKTKVIERAKLYNNRQTALYFGLKVGLNEKLVRSWRKDEDKVNKTLQSSSSMSQKHGHESRVLVEISVCANSIPVPTEALPAHTKVALI